VGTWRARCTTDSVPWPAPSERTRGWRPAGVSALANATGECCSAPCREGRTNGVVVDLVVAQVRRELAGNASVHAPDGVVQHGGSGLAWPVRPRSLAVLQYARDRGTVRPRMASCGGRPGAQRARWPRCAGERARCGGCEDTVPGAAPQAHATPAASGTGTHATTAATAATLGRSRRPPPPRVASPSVRRRRWRRGRGLPVFLVCVFATTSASTSPRSACPPAIPSASWGSLPPEVAIESWGRRPRKQWTILEAAAVCATPKKTKDRTVGLRARQPDQDALAARPPPQPSHRSAARTRRAQGRRPTRGHVPADRLHQASLKRATCGPPQAPATPQPCPTRRPTSPRRPAMTSWCGRRHRALAPTAGARWTDANAPRRVRCERGVRRGRAARPAAPPT